MRLTRILTIIWVFLYTSSACTCPDRDEFIKSNEGTCLCAYLDSEGIKTIGTGFNLEQPNAEYTIRE